MGSVVATDVMVPPYRGWLAMADVVLAGVVFGAVVAKGVDVVFPGVSVVVPVPAQETKNGMHTSSRTETRSKIPLRIPSLSLSLNLLIS
jgi:hypothetical protein